MVLNISGKIRSFEGSSISKEHTALLLIARIPIKKEGIASG
ncbi:MAG: hypothetical protein WCJ93_07775 [Methanomicrobiales archaeon]